LGIITLVIGEPLVHGRHPGNGSFSFFGYHYLNYCENKPMEMGKDWGLPGLAMF
jgi:hypothetical protein